MASLDPDSPFEDLLAKGRQQYSEEKTFDQWSLIMVQTYGLQVAPYLEDAWKIIAGKAEREREIKEYKGQSGYHQNDIKTDVVLLAEASNDPLPLDGWFMLKLRRFNRWVFPEFRGYERTPLGRLAPVPKESAATKLRNLVRSRRVILTVTLLLFVLAGTFPPWLFTLDIAEGPHTQQDAGFAFILSPPKTETARYAMGPLGRFLGVQIDTRRLLVEWVCILAVGGTAMLVVTRRTVIDVERKARRPLEPPRPAGHGPSALN